MASTVCGPALSTGTETPSPWSSALQSLLLTLASLAQIVLINSVLSGNNALVIAMAARHLPPPQGQAAMLWGGLVAIALRLALTMAVAYVLMVPGLWFVGRSCSWRHARMAYRWCWAVRRVTLLSTCARRSDDTEASWER